MRTAVFAVIAVGCADSGSTPERCTLEMTIAEFADVEPNCGVLGPPWMLPDARGSYGAARQCVNDHLAMRMPFRVDWDEQGVDSRPRGAYVGVERDGAWTVAFFDYDSYAGNTTNRYDCPDLSAVSVCDDQALFQTLCLQCNAPQPAARCTDQ